MSKTNHPGFDACLAGDFAKSGAYGVQVYGTVERAQGALSRMPREGMGNAVVLFNGRAVVCCNRVASMFVASGHKIAR